MEQRNVIFAIVFSIAILLGWQYFYEVPRMEKMKKWQETQQNQNPLSLQNDVNKPTLPLQALEAQPVDRKAIVENTSRISLSNNKIHGSISPVGGRIDDITLIHYRVTPDPSSDEITLLSPDQSKDAYFAEFGWVSGHTNIELPSAQTVWEITSPNKTLTPETPLILQWKNNQNLVFERIYEIDQDYMFTIVEKISNYSSDAVTMYPFALINRTNTPKTSGFFILHEGPIGVLNDVLLEYDYDDLQDSSKIEQSSKGGWLGITDKYWLASLIPPAQQSVKTNFRHTFSNGHDRYQVDYLGAEYKIPASGSVSHTHHFFAGAKEMNVLENYETQYQINRFDLAIDFGWFYFITKPLFKIMTWIYSAVGNFGIAILILTVFVKLLFFPLANKSYKAMSKMRLLHPKLMALRERFGDDRMRLNQEIMALYKKEKVSPASGCLPIFIQIPVFFSLYKVIFVTLEMRHAPFYGWIQDLSAPDPTSIVNLFGLLPFDPPSFLILGAWPILMGITMYLQQKLNPQPADPMQAKIFMYMPIFFTFILASFPAGLVIYWAWNNILSIIQQWYILKQTEKNSLKQT